MKKLSEINEGMFSGMVRRANSDQVKKEDDVNLLGLNAFCEYLQKHYQVIPPNKRGIAFVSMSFDNGIEVPLYYENKYSIWKVILHGGGKKEDTWITSVWIQQQMKQICPDIKEFLEEKFRVIEKNSFAYDIMPKDTTDTSNEFCIEVIDTILSHMKKPAIEKIK